MSVNLTIRNAPAELIDRLRRRAQRHRRSLNDELLAIIVDAVRDERALSPVDLFVAVRSLGLRTPTESTAIVRADRDGR
jgi:plasmid stability protein